MGTLWRSRWSELSKRSKTAFWITIMASMAGLVNVAFEFTTQSEALAKALSTLDPTLEAIILCGLTFLGVNMIKDNRNRRFGRLH